MPHYSRTEVSIPRWNDLYKLLIIHNRSRALLENQFRVKTSVASVCFICRPDSKKVLIGIHEVTVRCSGVLKVFWSSGTEIHSLYVIAEFVVSELFYLKYMEGKSENFNPPGLEYSEIRCCGFRYNRARM